MELRINGESRRIESPPDTPILWVLRDELGLLGTKFGCGIGQCGACTVHLDGVPIRGCITPVAAAAGRSITTIEGIAEPSGGALERAWTRLSVPQCGYCQSGQIMSAAALLTRNQAPSDSDIDQAMSGNICRCGTYGRIRKAIHTAARELRGEEAES